MVQKKDKCAEIQGSHPARGPGEAARAAARVRARDRARPRARHVSRFRICGDVARRSQRGDGDQPPSLYGTFGDKRDLFLKAYERYRAEAGVLFGVAFDPSFSLRQTLEKLYAIAIDFYTAGDNGPRGCLTVMTAASEAMSDPEIRQIAQSAITGTDRNLTRRIEKAIRDGELPPDTDAVTLGHVASATFQTLAIRARAGVPRADLANLVKGTVDLICGPRQARR